MNSTTTPQGHVLYRILTEKSRLGFGKFGVLTIKDILTIDKGEYLAYCYYCISKISFTDTILESIGVTDRIAKPGIDKAKFQAWQKARRQAISAQLSEEQRLHGRFVWYNRGRRRDKAALAKAERETSYTKAQLQSINHGHMKP